MQITAALLTADPALSTVDLAGELAIESERLERLRYDDGSGVSAQSVAAAFRLSYRRLDETQARIFRLLPVNPGPDVSTAAAGVLVDTPVGNVRQVLGDLARAHLIEVAPGASGRWRMHDLVRLYAQRLGDEEADADNREQARDRLLGYYLDMAIAAEGQLMPQPVLSTSQKFTGREDALGWLDAERSSLVAAVTMAADTGRDQVAMRLPLVLPEYMIWRRRYDDWIAITRISVDAATRLGDRPNEGVARNDLGLALRNVHRLDEAVTAHKDAIAIFRDIGDRRREGRALNNLGLALRELRRFGGAVRVGEQAAAIYQEIGDRHSAAMAMNNVGTSLRELQRASEAVPLHRFAAAIFRDTRDRHGEGRALNNLCAALTALGQIEEAIAAAQDAAILFRETGDWHGEGRASQNLGLALQEARRFDEAITAYQDAVAIFRKTGDTNSERIVVGKLQETSAARGA